MQVPLTRLLLLSVVLLTLGLCPASAQIGQPQQPIFEEFGDSPIPPVEERKVLLADYGGLLPGGGREEVFYACSGCHSVGRIKRSRMSRKQWDATLARLIADKAVPPLEPDERTIFLDYLAEQYGP